MDELKLLKEAIKKARKIVFFGGAGVSTASGIPDFRGKEGIYAIKSEYGVPYEVMLSHTYYMNHCETFYDFYKKKMLYPNAKPNLAHNMLVELEKLGKDVTIITQNIDGLHQLAGSSNVIELHGSVLRNYCEKCHTFYNLNHIINSKGIPVCDKCNGRVKPDVVLYEEQLNYDSLDNAIKSIQNADLFIVGGTSLNVYPAASLVRYCQENCLLVIINLDITPYDKYADIVIQKDLGSTLKEVIS